MFKSTLEKFANTINKEVVYEEDGDSYTCHIEFTEVYADGQSEFLVGIGGSKQAARKDYICLIRDGVLVSDEREDRDGFHPVPRLLN